MTSNMMMAHLPPMLKDKKEGAGGGGEGEGVSEMSGRRRGKGGH